MGNIIQPPISLSRDTVLQLHIFERDHGEIIELWLGDIEKFQKEKYQRYKDSAKQLIDQMYDRCTMRFMYALRDEIDGKIKTWEKECEIRNDG